jgi:hypothetical protein
VNEKPDAPPAKDLTSLIDRIRKLDAEGLLPEAPGGAEAVADKPIEPIQNFESLEEYGQKNPVEHTSPTAGSGASILEDVKPPSISEFESLEDYGRNNPEMIAEVPTESSVDTDFPETPASEVGAAAIDGMVSSEDAFPTTEVEGSQELLTEAPLEGAQEVLAEPPLEGSPELLTEAPLDAAPEPFGEPAQEASHETALETPKEPLPLQQESPPSSSELDLRIHTRNAVPPREEPTPLPPPSSEEGTEWKPETRPLSGASALRQMRNTSETIGAPVSTEWIPFTLRIDGVLKPEESARLLDHLETEKYPLDPKSLQLQLQAGRILIPRVSEYAAVSIVRLLRASSATLSLSPSEENQDWATEISVPRTAAQEDHEPHPADSIPLLTGSPIAGFETTWQNRWPDCTLDTLLVSRILISSAVEVADSEEYARAVEVLKKELQYRAHFKGALMLGDLRETLTPLGDRPTKYRISLSATALLRKKDSAGPTPT